MRVFRVRVQSDQYQYLAPMQAADWPNLRTGGSPRAATWAAPQVGLAHPERPAGDCFNYYGDTLIMGPRATTALSRFLAAAGELLRLPCATDGQIYGLLNVLECVDCLDHARTRIAQDGASEGHQRITTYAFHAGRLPLRSPLFKLPETCEDETLVWEGYYQRWFDFRYIVEIAGLRGIVFEPLWTDGHATDVRKGDGSSDRDEDLINTDASLVVWSA